MKVLYVADAPDPRLEARVREFVARLAPRTGTVQHLVVAHDPHCPKLARTVPCACEPEFRIAEE